MSLLRLLLLFVIFPAAVMAAETKAATEPPFWWKVVEWLLDHPVIPSSFAKRLRGRIGLKKLDQIFMTGTFAPSR